MGTRRPLILGNWKMNNKLNDLDNFISGLKEELSKTKIVGVDFGFAPSFPFIHTAKQQIQKDNVLKDVKIGAQNACVELKGAFTGAVSVDMLKSINTDFVILGHSERRQIFKETDELIEQKLHVLLDNDMPIVFCVGESKEEREAEKQNDIVKAQILAVFKNLKNFDTNNIVIAYEPIWAIGTGLTASPEDAESMHSFIRETIENIYGKTVADSVKILYGGSVKPANIKELINKENVDGALVGGASLDYISFLDIVKGAQS